MSSIYGNMQKISLETANLNFQGVHLMMQKYAFWIKHCN